MEYSKPKVSERNRSSPIDSFSSNDSLQRLSNVCRHCAKNLLIVDRRKKSTSSAMPNANSKLDTAHKCIEGEDFASGTTTESKPEACYFALKNKFDAMSANPMAHTYDELDFLPVKNRSIEQNKRFWHKHLQFRHQDPIVSERVCRNRLSNIRKDLESWKSFDLSKKSRNFCVSSWTETEMQFQFDQGNEDHARRRSSESHCSSLQRNRFGTEARSPLKRKISVSRKTIHSLKYDMNNRIPARTAEGCDRKLTPVGLRASSNDLEVDGRRVLSSTSRSWHRKNKPMSYCITAGSGSCFGLNKGNSVVEWNLDDGNEATTLPDENNGLLLSDGGVLPVVAEILQDNLCKNRNRCNVATVLLEGKIDASATDSNPLFGEEYPVDNRATEAKLLGEIKRRIDRDFELSLYRNGEASRLVGTWKTSENAKPWIGVDSIDAGVSMNISRHESESRKYDYDERTEAHLPGDDRSFSAMSVGPDDNFVEDIIDAQVEKAVRRLTEELIMCERRAVERGLIADRGRDSRVYRSRTKPCRKAKHHNRGYFPGRNYAFSYRIRRPSSELEYLDNISPPSLCSVSDPSSTPRKT